MLNLERIERKEEMWPISLNDNLLTSLVSGRDV